MCKNVNFSQEQLLEEQQQELELLRIAKLRELEKRKARFTERKFKGKNLREHSIFYTTVTLAFFSVSAGASILFLVPLYVGELSTIFFPLFFATTTNGREEIKMAKELEKCMNSFFYDIPLLTAIIIINIVVVHVRIDSPR